MPQRTPEDKEPKLKIHCSTKDPEVRLYHKDTHSPATQGPPTMVSVLLVSQLHA